MNIYVGNLNFDTDEDGMRDAFEKHGTVDRVNLIYNRDTGRSRGFGFVEMPNEDEARAAMDALNGQQLDGRTLTVNEARPRTPRGGGGGRGGGGSRGRGGGGGYGGGRGGRGGGGYDRDRSW